MIERIIENWDIYRLPLLGFAQKIVTAVIIIIIGIVLSRTFRRLLSKASSGTFKVESDVSNLFRHIVRYGIFIICVIMVLNVFGVNTASLIAVIGAAGVAIGLALKDTLGNIAAGIILMFLGSYRRGEFIEFGSFSGIVKDISLFTTTLETPDGIYISAPNSSIWGIPLRNYTRNGKRRMELSINISYSDSLDVAFQVLREIIASETRFMKEPAPQVILQNLNDGSATMVIRAWATSDVYWDIYWFQMRNIKDKIEEAGLRIPYPQREVRILKDEKEVVSVTQ